MDSLSWVTCMLLLNILIFLSFLWCTPVSLKLASVVLVGLQLEMFVMICSAERFWIRRLSSSSCQYRKHSWEKTTTTTHKQWQEKWRLRSYSLRKHKHWNVCICCLHVHITNSISVYSFELPACVWDAAVQQHLKQLWQLSVRTALVPFSTGTVLLMGHHWGKSHCASLWAWTAHQLETNEEWSPASGPQKLKKTIYFDFLLPVHFFSFLGFILLWKKRGFCKLGSWLNSENEANLCLLHCLKISHSWCPFAVSRWSVWVGNSFPVRQLLPAYVFSRHYWNTMKENTQQLSSIRRAK